MNGAANQMKSQRYHLLVQMNLAVWLVKPATYVKNGYIITADSDSRTELDI